MRLTWRSEWPHWLLLAGMSVLAAISWGIAPDQIPSRWNLTGEVSAYTDKAVGLLGLPLLALALYLLLAFIPRIDPLRGNYAQFAGTYALIRLSILALLALIYGMTHLWIRGRQIDMAASVPLLIGALFFMLGSVMNKLRPNWFVGIRTPWTLSSKLSWEKTHRLGGWVFMGMGILMMAIAVVRSSWALAALGLVIGASLAWTLVYSYIVWKHDPNKIPPGFFPTGER